MAYYFHLQPKRCEATVPQTPAPGLATPGEASFELYGQQLA